MKNQKEGKRSRGHEEVRREGRQRGGDQVGDVCKKSGKDK